MTLTSAREGAIRRATENGLKRIAELQTETGELESHASPLDDGPPVWVSDQLKFITALSAVALSELSDPVATRIVDKSVTFLCKERESMSQWRYWAQSNAQFDFTPPDVDDTACASMALATRGISTRSNVALLARNRDSSGRFYTWLIPHGGSLSVRQAWAMRDEFRSSIRSRRKDLWETTEAQPGDVDAVVNTNVVRYLGNRRSTMPAIRWIASIIESGNEDDCDAWHRNRYTLYAAIGDAVRRGVTGFDDIAGTIAERISERVLDGSVGTPLDSAFALLALDGLGEKGPLIETIADYLIDSQQDDGSWAKSVFFYGGPKEAFGWASEALTGASALQALSRVFASTSGNP